MKKLIIVMLGGILAAVTGCKSITVERHPATLATITQTNGVVTAALDANGKPVILDGGWEVSYFQHWTWTKLDTLSASAGPGVSLSLNGYESGADSNLVALVKTSFDGAALLAAKVGAAIATAGGSAGVDGVAEMIRSFVAKGGDAAKATVNCSGGSCTVTDGTITESCTDCFK